MPLHKLKLFAVHGLPDTLVTDSGPMFTNELFSEFMQQNGIHHIQTAPFHPASNGLAEQAVQTVKEGLMWMTGDSLSTQPSCFCLNANLMPQTITACTASEMLMGHRSKSRLDMLNLNMKTKNGDKAVKTEGGT